MDKQATLVPGLDEVLLGGLPAHSTILISGVPGSGKTVLASQIIYRNATAGRKALFVSTISEPLARLLQFTQGFTFFDPDKVGAAVLYEDLGPALLEGNGQAALARLEALLMEHRPAFLVIDSFRALHDLSASDSAARRSLYRLVATLATFPILALLVGEYQQDDLPTTLESTVVDGILHLENRVLGLQQRRMLTVLKMRGADYRAGRHAFHITDDGLVVFPRFVTPERPATYAVGRERLSSGVPGLDEMLHGGLLRGSITLLTGDPGVGKTVTALHFALAATPPEPTVYFTFQEDPNQLTQIARNFGLPVAERLQDGTFHIAYRSPVELDIDAYALHMLETIRRTQARRVVVDSITDLEAGAFGDRDRFYHYLYTLAQWLKDHQITAIFTSEMSHLFANDLVLTGRGVSHLADNLILLRYAQVKSRIHHTLTVLATRASAHATEVRDYIINEESGPRLGAPLRGAYTVLPAAFDRP